MSKADRFDTGKSAIEFNLLGREVQEVEASVWASGAKKYSAGNWLKGQSTTKAAGSLLRHLMAYLDGENDDPESGLPHIGHIITSAKILANGQLKGFDDRHGTDWTKKEIGAVALNPLDVSITLTAVGDVPYAPEVGATYQCRGVDRTITKIVGDNACYTWGTLGRVDGADCQLCDCDIFESKYRVPDAKPEYAPDIGATYYEGRAHRTFTSIEDGEIWYDYDNGCVTGRKKRISVPIGDISFEARYKV